MQRFVPERYKIVEFEKMAEERVKHQMEPEKFSESVGQFLPNDALVDADEPVGKDVNEITNALNEPPEEEARHERYEQQDGEKRFHSSAE